MHERDSPPPDANDEKKRKVILTKSGGGGEERAIRLASTGRYSTLSRTFEAHDHVLVMIHVNLILSQVS